MFTELIDAFKGCSELQILSMVDDDNNPFSLENGNMIINDLVQNQ